MSDSRLARRDLFKTAGVAGLSAALPTAAVPAPETTPREGANRPPSAQQSPVADPPASNARAYTLLNATEAAFLESAVAVFIPKDDLGPGALEVGGIPKDDLGPGALEVGGPYYIDRQLSGAFGHGARIYLQGLFADGRPQQGYQLPLTSQQICQLGIRAVNEHCQSLHNNKTFDQLTAQRQDDLLKRLEQGHSWLVNMRARHPWKTRTKSAQRDQEPFRPNSTQTSGQTP